MFRYSNRLPLVAGAVLALSLFAAPVAAQGNCKRYAVSNDKAVSVTREVLVRRGFEVVRVETHGDTRRACLGVSRSRRPSPRLARGDARTLTCG